MHTNLWGQVILPKEISVSVYHDEREITNRWLYHSFLFVPIENENEVLDCLKHAREESRWGKEVHFSNLERTDTENRLALGWIDLFAQSLFDKVYFYFFGINYQNLEKTLWETRQRDFKIYNRFFQIGLYGAMKWFFLNGATSLRSLRITNVFSDKKLRAREDRFHTQPIEEIETKSWIKQESIVFQNPRIIEIDSSHEKEHFYPEKSHLVQLLDLIMGAFSQIFDDTSTQEGKCMVADRCLEFQLPTKLMKYNRNSRYHKKYAVSFFPRRELSKKEILEGNITGNVNEFYNERSMKYAIKCALRNQLPLSEDWVVW